MNVRNFFSNINEGKIAQLYLLHGEEEYGKAKALEAIEKSLDAATFDFNYDLLIGADADAIIVAASTMPMMSDRRIVVCKDTSAFAKSDVDADKLKTFIENIPHKTTLVFFERGKVDQRKAFYKAIAKNGAAILFDFYSESDATKWVKNYAKNYDKVISNRVAMEIVSMAGVDLSNLNNEMAKICAYCDDEIDIESVRNIVRPQMEYSVFEMLEQFIAGKNAQALEKLDDSLEVDGIGAAMQLLSFFGSRIRNMLIAARVLKSGGSAQQAVTAIGGNAYAAKKSVEAARKFTLEKLEDATVALYNADKDIKSGRKGAREALTDSLMSIFVLK